MDKIDCVYFELNNWERYPDAEPFISWMNDGYDTEEEEEKSWIKNHIKDFNDYCIKNKLVVVMSLIDMSFNYCVTASKSWVEENCPELLTKYTSYLRHEDSDGNLPLGRFNCPFFEYTENNYGCHYACFDNDNNVNIYNIYRNYTGIEG